MNPNTYGHRRHIVGAWPGSKHQSKIPLIGEVFYKYSRISLTYEILRNIIAMRDQDYEIGWALPAAPPIYDRQFCNMNSLEARKNNTLKTLFAKTVWLIVICHPDVHSCSYNQTCTMIAISHRTITASGGYGKLINFPRYQKWRNCHICQRVISNSKWWKTMN